MEPPWLQPVATGRKPLPPKSRESSHNALNRRGGGRLARRPEHPFDRRLRDSVFRASEPIGLHRVTVSAIESRTLLRALALEAIDGTPILDLEGRDGESRDE
jgi:hypothetical protein